MDYLSHRNFSYYTASSQGHQRKLNATNFHNRNFSSESGTTGPSPLFKNGQMLFGGFIQLQFHSSLIGK
jgi:hypothetical protein